MMDAAGTLDRARLVNELVVVDRWMPCRCRLYMPELYCSCYQWRGVVAFITTPEDRMHRLLLYIINQVTDPPYGTVQ